MTSSSCLATTSLRARPAVVRRSRGAHVAGRSGCPSRAVPRVRVTASSSAAQAVAPTNPLAGIALTTPDGVAKTVPFWDEDQTVVVTFLRHFG